MRIKVTVLVFCQKALFLRVLGLIDSLPDRTTQKSSAAFALDGARQQRNIVYFVGYRLIFTYLNSPIVNFLCNCFITRPNARMSAFADCALLFRME